MFSKLSTPRVANLWWLQNPKRAPVPCQESHRNNPAPRPFEPELITMTCIANFETVAELICCDLLYDSASPSHEQRDARFCLCDSATAS